MLFALVTPVVAQDSPREAWKTFVKSHGPDWTVQWKAATGTPAAIYGTGLDLPGRADTLEEARRRALATLENYSVLLGRGPSKFVESISGEMNNVWSFVYDQTFADLIVIGGRADVRVHKNGGISLFGSECYSIPANFNVRPQLTAAQARAIAFADRGVKMPQLRAPGQDRLVIWTDQTAGTPMPVRLAWEIDVQHLSTNTAGKNYIDAQNGKVLSWRNDYHECNFGCSAPGAPEPAPLESSVPVLEVEYGLPMYGPMAANVIGTVKMWANTGLRPTDPLKLIPVENVLVSVQGGNRGYTDTTGAFNISHTGNTPVTILIEFKGKYVADTQPQQGTKLRLTPTVTPGVPASIVIYNPTVNLHDFGQSTGYWGTDNINQWVRGLMGVLPTRIDAIICKTSLNRTCNAHYSNYTINFYHKGGNCNMTCYSTVINHEWGHGIDAAYGGISQTDGLSEGWGDILAILETNQPLVGEAFFTNGNSIRTALNTRTYPAGGGVHQQGQTWMGWAWDVRENLRKRLGSGGVTLTNRIIVPTLRANARNQPDAVREVFIADDDDNNLNNGTPNYNDLETACLKRKLPYPKRKLCGYDATFATYGAGCRTAGQGCKLLFSQNWQQKQNNATTTANQIAIMEFNRPVANICAVDFYTKSRSGNVTVTVGIAKLSPTTGKPDKLLTSGTVTVGTTAKTYQAKMPTLKVNKSDIFLIVFDNADKLVLSTVSTGNQTYHYARNGNNWSELQSNIRWQYRIHNDAGAQVPALTNTGLPSHGKSFSVDLGFAPSSRAAALLVGASKAKWGALNLPLDLTSAGAPGCSVLAAGHVVMAFLTSGTGTGSVSFPVPAESKLCNLKMYFQYLVFDPTANKLGVVLSNGGEGSIGN